MSAADIEITIRGRARAVALASYLDAEGAERAAVEANAWIKSLRHARVEGRSFRERFTYGDDSLWWFAELYLHKERAVLAVFRALHAGRALLEREAPDAIGLAAADLAAKTVVGTLARGRGITVDGDDRAGASPSLLAMDTRSTSLMLAALASPGRPIFRARRQPATIAAFVHRAFWRTEGEDGSAESYIGPVLQALERQLPEDAIRYVGVGPSTNFRERRWHIAARATSAAVTPIEALVPRQAMAASTGLWAARHAMRRAMQGSDDLRAAAIIAGCDCWPIVAPALAGIALLQFPWSARAIDEAGAALDALAPSAALTYAEAGGWGRAIAIAARRRGIPLAGLQHGFIYRHWLNYLHEPDEMAALAPPARDAGFPAPALTLAFDEYAAGHLRRAGSFPSSSVAVTGSPRLDQLASTFASLDEGSIAVTRGEAGAAPGQALALLVTKYVEAQRVLPDLVAAVAGRPDVHLAIKTHPAEAPAPYLAAAAGVPNVRVLPASAPLAPLLRASRAVVTVNSTVALDAMALGVPALTIGLPNNLSPFVDAGGLAGAHGADEIAAELGRVLYDEQFRQRLSAAASTLVAEYRMKPDGRAAERSASAVLGLVRRTSDQD